MLRLCGYLSLILLTSCAFDELPEPEEGSCDGIGATYVLNIRSLIDESCAYAGCHPAYRSYEALLPVLEDGSFRSRVITLRDDANLGMPPDYAPPGRPADLTQEQITLIRCWLSSGYPEN